MIFQPYEYTPVFALEGASIATGSVGSQEGPRGANRASAYISADTSTGLELVGYRNEKGEQFLESRDSRKLAVIDKFLFIPNDCTLETMSLMLFSFTTLRSFTDKFLANGMTASIIQIDYSKRLPSPAKLDETVLYGPEPFSVVDNKVRLIKPNTDVQPGLPVFLRIVTITAIAEALLPLTTDIALANVPGRDPAPANPTVTTVSPARYRLLLSIPMSIARVRSA